jgi:hypothetical protein
LLRAYDVWGVATARGREERGSGVGTEGVIGEEDSIVGGWAFSVLAGHCCCGDGWFRDDR